MKDIQQGGVSHPFVSFAWLKDKRKEKKAISNALLVPPDSANSKLWAKMLSSLD